MADETPTGRRLVTEAANPRTADLDRLPIGELLERIMDEDAQVSAAVRAARPALELATLALVEALDAGGRWFNVGAGTSGRIGSLDAAEIPPTFGLPPERVQALIAGGPAALSGPVEGAEDDVAAAPRELDKLRLGPGDAVVALSASGRTPFAVSALEHARRRGARAIAITCAPGSPLTQVAEIAIVAGVGPAVIAGPPRLQGGAAPQMIPPTPPPARM